MKKNYKNAIKYFESTGELPLDRKPREYVLHHKDQSWKTEDPERYNLWNVEDLVVMTKSEHSKLHLTGAIGRHTGWNHSEEAKCAISEKNKGRIKTDEEKRKLSESHIGIKFTDEHRKHMSDAAKERNQGKHWYNNGIENVFCYECPEGYLKGLIRMK